jgi:hypothetical protein
MNIFKSISPWLAKANDRHRNKIRVIEPDFVMNRASILSNRTWKHERFHVIRFDLELPIKTSVFRHQKALRNMVTHGTFFTLRTDGYHHL